MAGHSKWNNIKNRKAAVDKKRAKVFSQVAKLIRVAVKEGGSDDPQFNPGLRVALDKAKAANMPKANIERAIERGLGKTASGTQLHETAYEGYGPGGVAIIATAITDNPNRTSSELKYTFSRAGGSLGAPGSAKFMFTRSEDGGFTPTMAMEVSDADKSQLESLLDTLLENEDVEDVYTTASNVSIEE